MRSPLWADDEVLLADLADALRSVGPVSEGLLEAGRGAWCWRTVDAELDLASLVFDSCLDHGVLVRGTAAATRTLVFDGTDLSVEIEVVDGMVVGQLVPAGPGEVTMVTPAGTSVTVPADTVGCFVFNAVPAEPVRLRATTHTGAALVTEWVPL